jgi:hypothetical protein
VATLYVTPAHEAADAGAAAPGLFGELAHAAALAAMAPAHSLKSTRTICVLVMRTPFDQPSDLVTGKEEGPV